MKITSVVLLTCILSLKFVKPESCYFDFEQANELDNFDRVCNGNIGEWVIVPTPNVPSNDFVVGTSAVTTAVGKAACMKTAKSITVPKNLQFTADLFLRILSYSVAIEVSVELWDANNQPISEIKIYGPESVFSPNDAGEWKRASYQFDNEEGDYLIAIKMFHNEHADVLLDKILLENLPSDDCYMVPKPTSSTPEPTSTTMTTEPTSSTVTTELTSTSVTTESTSSIITTELTSTTMTTESTSSTITTELTSTSIATEPTSTTMTTELTSTTMTSEPMSTAMTTVSTTISTESGSSYEVTSEISTKESHTTTEPTPGNSGFSFLYIVAIIAASGGLLLLSTCTTFIILRKRRSKKKFKRRRNETYA